MRPTQFSTDTISALLRNQTIASLAEVMAALGAGASRRTAFRKLKDIDARTSYSHRGRYYTLDQLAHFDERGLWSFAGVRFSRAGTLIATAETFVNHAEAGHFADELDNLLGVGTRDALRKLVDDGRLTRHKLAGQFLYCASDRAHQTHQVRASTAALHETTGLGLQYNPGPSVNDDKMQERWAAKLAEPGGYAEIDRQITRTINLDQDLMPKRVPGRYQSREDVSGRDQAGRSNQEVAARAASALRRQGGDDVPAPPSRPTPASEAAGAQTQTQKKGDGTPGGDGTPQH